MREYIIGILVLVCILLMIWIIKTQRLHIKDLESMLSRSNAHAISYKERLIIKEKHLEILEHLYGEVTRKED